MTDEPAFVDKTRIAPIGLEDAHGRWEFAPQPDITPLEAVLIAHLFSRMILGEVKGAGRMDWREYLTGREVVLSRHFKKVG